MTAVELNRDEVRAALHAVDAYRRGHAAAGRPVPALILALLRRLETIHHTTGVEESTCQSRVDLSGESEAWIGSGQAAELLGISPRAVWRRRRSLDGRQINGRWWFPVRTIRDMKPHKEIDA
ncbi:hypothetical protein [Mycolicibacterium sp. XJ1819]